MGGKGGNGGKGGRQSGGAGGWIIEGRGRRPGESPNEYRPDRMHSDFVACDLAKGRTSRKESERFKGFTCEDLTRRDKADQDISWLKVEALEESANRPAPEVIAAEIVADLEAVLEQFRGIEEDPS